jgi:phasin family protein
MRVIGFLSSRLPGESTHHVAAFRLGLNESGYVEGAIEYRWADPALASELASKQVSVIAATGGNVSGLAADREKGRTSGALHKEEESMATQSFLDMIQEFGTGLGVPKVDVDKLIEVHRRNIDALGRSAQVATEGAKSLADKQREIIETAFRETSAMVRDFKPTGNPQEMLVKQTEFAKKAFDITLQNTRDIAELAMKTTSDATAIVRERLRESLSELRDSVSLAGSEMPKKK